MSLKTWKKEFYPITAKRCSKKNALAHSLLKWRGLQKSNLKKHGMCTDDCGDVIENKTEKEFIMGISTCSLCTWFRQANFINITYWCPECPLKIDEYFPCDDEHGAYREWLIDQDPKPMIKLIRKAIK